MGISFNTPTETANASTLHTRAQNALANNQAFLAIPAPTNAQALAQIQALTRQVDAIIKVLMGQFADTAGT